MSIYSLPRQSELEACYRDFPVPSVIQARLDWLNIARPNQITPDGDWRIWLILAGRGWGKTLTGAQDLAEYGCLNPGVRLGIIAPTHGDARDTCMEGETGLLKFIPKDFLVSWNRSLGEVTLVNGTRVKLFSADEPERLRGPQHHRIWADELAAWKTPAAFDQAMFGLRLGEDPRMVITTTPKPTRLIKELVARSDVMVTRGRTDENASNLPEATLRTFKEKYEGTRLGRQELDAEILEDVQGALWKRSLIEQLRVDKIPCGIIRTVVAIDPAVSTNDKSNETGIIAASKGEDGHFYIQRDRSGVYSPEGWGREAVALYRLLQADRVVGELNQGGDLVENNVRVIDPNIAFKGVRASKGKFTRAEPVAALYEKLKVHHVGTFAKLEDQMCGFVPDVDRKNEGSPDRVDALVWALHELAVLGFAGSGILEYYARQDQKASAPKPTPVRVRPKTS